MVSYLGFAIGSFLSFVFFNYFFTQFFYLIIWLGKWPRNLFNFLITNINQPNTIKQATISFFLKLIPQTKNYFYVQFNNFKNWFSTPFISSFTKEEGERKIVTQTPIKY
uniref:hypothetical protein RF1 n=1 Tax=Cephaleuros karstenii TaxID=1985640 RepID=UPI001EDF64DC|nr:hypothetical protein RF1 [Cephaleuros karstenii]UIB39106.1 hypothetical protein RF1 [Cephaleuros karstenii]